MSAGHGPENNAHGPHPDNAEPLAGPQPSTTEDIGDSTETATPRGAAGGGSADWSGRVIGDYALVDRLGAGGMGVVYRALQRSARRHVALKLIRLDRLDELTLEKRARWLERFRAEAQAAARLEHDNIVAVYEVGDIDGVPYYSMRYIRGASLAQIVRDGPLENRRAAELMERVARAVDYAHASGILHRDLKPHNILVAGDDAHEPAATGPAGSVGGAERPYVSDFGLAKCLDDDVLGATHTGEVMGTPSYMSPEQARDASRCTASSDLYSLGATLYDLVTGRPPFRAASLVETLRQVLEQEPVPPRELNPAIDLDLETITVRCLAKDPARRYASVTELADDLRRYLHGEPIRARPVGQLERLHRWSRRNPVVARLLATIALLLVAGITISSYFAITANVEKARADIKTGEAQQSASQVRSLLVESYATTAQIALERGRWRTAVHHFDEALRAGHPDELRLRIGRTRALLSVLDIENATKELDALAARADLGAYQGLVELWRVDYALTRPSSGEAMRNAIQAALASGLEAPYEAYAQGLVAETVPAAVARLQHALELDPYQHRARGILAVMLILQGNFRDAEYHVRLGQLLFPEDPNFRVLEALSLALEGDREGALSVLETTREAFGDAQVEAFRTALEFLAEMHDFDWSLSSDSGFSNTALLTVASKVLGLSRVARVLPGPQVEGELKPMTALNLPPVLARGYGQLLVGLPRLAIPFDDGGIEQMQRIVEVHPEGTLHYLHGVALLIRNRFSEAEAELLRAADGAAVFPVQSHALYMATVCEAALAWVRPVESEAERAQYATKAVANARRVMSLGPLRNDQAYMLSRIFRKAGEFDLALTVIRDWENRAPDDLNMLSERAAAELGAGDYPRAIEFARKILARDPQHAEARQHLDQATDELRRAAGTLGDDPGR